MLVTGIHPFLAAILIYASALALAACESHPGATSEPREAPKASGAEVKAIGSYVFLRGREDHSAFIVSSGARIDSADRLKARFGKSFLWFVHERKPYVIQDETVLAQVGELFKGDASLEEQDHRLEAQENRLEAQRSGLEARRDALDDRLERLDEKEEAQGGSAAAAERRAIDQGLQALDKELQTLDQAAEKLSAERETLSARQEKLMEAAERRLLRLMQEWVNSGVARPAADKMKAS